MSIFRNVNSSVGRGVEKGESLLKDSAEFAAARSSDIWDGMKSGAKAAASVASELPEVLDFNSDPLFNAQFGFGDGTVRAITDGSSNTVLVGEERNGAERGQRDYDRDGQCQNVEERGGRDDYGWGRDYDHRAERGHGGGGEYGRDGSQWNSDPSCDGRHNESISPVEMLQQMQDISQQLQELTALLASSGFGSAAGEAPGHAADSRAGFGFEGSIQTQIRPFQLVGQIAELAKQLAPIAAKLAPALIALV